jgi:hypothetical protein
MRCQCRFSVKGSIRVKDDVPVPGRAAVYSFEKDEPGVITHILATVPVSDPSDWPRFSSTPAGPTAGTFHNGRFDLVAIRAELRVIEGLLSVHGMESIGINELDESWLADSEEEQASLQLYSTKFSKNRPANSQFDFLEFEIVARSVIAAAAATDIEVALNFFRRGSNDVLEERYIDAFYDFYFMIESRYAGGKFKQTEAKNKLLSSVELVTLIEETLRDETLPEILTEIPGGAV